MHSMELLADDVADLIRVTAPEGADVVGLSMGGYVALALAERHPELLRSLVLANTRCRADTAEGRAGREATIIEAVTRGRAALAGRLLQVFLPPDADRLVAARVRTMIESTPVETLVADVRGMWDRPDRGSVLSGLDLPVLCLAGRRDALVAVEEVEEMAELAGGTLEVIADAGHLPPMETPDEFNHLLARFWADLS